MEQKKYCHGLLRWKADEGRECQHRRSRSPRVRNGAAFSRGTARPVRRYGGEGSVDRLLAMLLLILLAWLQATSSIEVVKNDTAWEAIVDAAERLRANKLVLAASQKGEK